ncbi:hypothetical protein NQ315_000236, partial [Exocentrus adspersus]
MFLEIALFCTAFVIAPVSLDENVTEASHYFIHPKDSKTPKPRIIGGQEVAAHSYPFQAALRIFKGGDGYFCGGSLISNHWVLTAAHCLNFDPDKVEVTLGAHNLNNLSTALVMTSTSYRYHKDYNGTTYQYDVGLIRLPKNVTFTDQIRPVVLANGTNQFADASGTIIGWGQTNTEYLAAVLQSVNVTLLSNEACAATSLEYQKLIVNMHLCTSGEGVVGSCNGDSGGPLMVDGVQVGIVSFGPTDCLLGYPSVFARVSYYHDWIWANAVDGAGGCYSSLLLTVFGL